MSCSNITVPPDAYLPCGGQTPRQLAEGLRTFTAVRKHERVALKALLKSPAIIQSVSYAGENKSFDVVGRLHEGRHPGNFRFRIEWSYPDVRTKPGGQLVMFYFFCGGIK